MVGLVEQMREAAVDWFRAKFPNHPYEHTTDSLKISSETLALIDYPAG